MPAPLTPPPPHRYCQKADEFYHVPEKDEREREETEAREGGCGC